MYIFLSFQPVASLGRSEIAFSLSLAENSRKIYLSKFTAQIGSEKNNCKFYIFSSPEPKAHGELIVYQSSRRPSVRPSVCASVRASTLSNMNISATSKPIATKFYLKHHWGGGKAASGFWPDRIGTLVSMATESSHRVIMEKILLAL